MIVDRELVVRDEQGAGRIVLTASEKISRIAIRGSDQTEMAMEVDGHEGRICFRRSSGAAGAVIASTDTRVSVTVFDQNGKPMCVLEVNTERRVGSFSGFNESGQMRRLYEDAF